VSKVIGQAIRNSILVTGSALFTSGINFISIFAFTRFFTQEGFGAYVSAQAQVALWLLCVDLGLYNGVIGSLTAARAEFGADSPVLSAILRRSFVVRLLGSLVAFAMVAAIANHQARAGGGFNQEIFWRDLAFVPYLFGYACQQNLTPYLAYAGNQELGVFAHLGAVFITAGTAIVLAAQGAPVGWVLFTVSLSGFVASLLILLFWQAPKGGKPPARYGIWKHLWLNSWPYALIFATSTVWQRLDQVRAADTFGLVLGGEYGLAARLVGIPILMIAAVSVALFPDFQRTGVDAPAKLRRYVTVMLKFLLRFGLLLALVILGGVALVLSVLFPKYQASLHLLPWFVPGIWAYGLFNFANNGLLGMRSFRFAVASHLGGLVVYLGALYTLPELCGLKGVALAYDSFCFALFLFTYWSLKRVPGWEGVALFRRFSADEFAVLAQVKEKIRGRFQ
jgi:O-antigen/teichoic acid export membrane protein